MAETRPELAGLTPADHALAHALTLYASTVRPAIGPNESLGMAIRRVGGTGCGDNPIARRMHMIASDLLRATPGSTERSRIDGELRTILREFHEWRMRLALDRIEPGEKTNG